MGCRGDRQGESLGSRLSSAAMCHVSEKCLQCPESEFPHLQSCFLTQLVAQKKKNPLCFVIVILLVFIFIHLASSLIILIK